MNELERLIQLVEKRGKRTLGRFIDLSQDSLEGKLYLLCRDNKVEDDAAAMITLYGNCTDAKGYKMLKARLKKKLYAAVDALELDDNTLKPYAYDEQQCLTLLNRANTLIRLGEHNLASKQISKAITIAKEIGMGSILVRCYELKYWILFEQNDFNGFKACEQELERYRRVYNLEQEAQIIHFNARLGIKQAVTEREEYLDLLPNSIKLLEQKWDETNSAVIYERLNVLRMQYYELIGDYQGIIESVENAEVMLNEGKINKKWLDQKFNKFMKLYALLQLKKYEEGLKYAQKIEKCFNYGTKNWSAFMENYFLLALQYKKYDIAKYILSELSVSAVSALMINSAKERWILYIRFYNLLAGANFSSEQLFGKEAKNLLNETVKDKQGFNVAIIILDVFDLLKQGELEDTSLYYDRIRKYISKYLNKKEAERPRLFLKLLLLMFRKNLDVAACRTKGKYLLEKLKNTPLPGNAFSEVEIVPYEDLWELVLKHLEIYNQKVLCS